MKNRDLSHSGGVLPMIIAVIIAGIISLFLACDIVSAFGLQLDKMKLTGKSKMSLAKQEISVQSNIPPIDLSQSQKFETATFGLG